MFQRDASERLKKRFKTLYNPILRLSHSDIVRREVWAYLKVELE
jgi:hypothetical protein